MPVVVVVVVLRAVHSSAVEEAVEVVVLVVVMLAVLHFAVLYSHCPVVLLPYVFSGKILMHNLLFHPLIHPDHRDQAVYILFWLPMLLILNLLDDLPFQQNL